MEEEVREFVEKSREVAGITVNIKDEDKVEILVDDHEKDGLSKVRDKTPENYSVVPAVECLAPKMYKLVKSER